MGDISMTAAHEHREFEDEAVSDSAQSAAFERIEDEEDLAALHAALAEDDGTRFTHEQVRAELGL